MKKRSKLLFGLMLTLALVLTFAATALAADQPATPEVDKDVVSNGDGTYTISLSIKGDADTNTKKTNVIFILDASNSMYGDNSAGVTTTTYTKVNGTPNPFPNNTYYGAKVADPDVHSEADFVGPLTRRGYAQGGTSHYVYTYADNTATDPVYYPTNNNGGGGGAVLPQYGLVNGSYVELTRTGGPGTGQPVSWTTPDGDTYNGVRYAAITGVKLYEGTDFYTRATAGLTRMEATLPCMEAVAETLLGYNQGADDDTVEVALVVFSSAADTSTVVQPTTSYDAFKTGAEGFRDDQDYHGTNWAAALTEAARVNFQDPADEENDTYVIFFTDGQPTTDGNYQVQPAYEASLDPARHLVAPVTPEAGSDEQPGLGYTLYSIFAFGDGANYLRQMTNYAYTKNESTAPAENYFYSATGTSAVSDLQAAFADILSRIAQGIADASMDDGVSVKDPVTSQKLIDLVTVVDGSYKYYRAYGKNDNGTEKYDHTLNDGKGPEWTDIPDSCQANTNSDNSSVIWNLKDATTSGVLEDDVVYTVTFECATSQDALDMIAELKNGTIELVKDGDPDDPDIPNVPAAIAPYITKDDGGDYTMLTNSGLTVKYKDTRVGDDVIDYDPEITIDPVPIDAEPISIEKSWVGEYKGEQGHEEIVIGIMMDGEDSDAFGLTISEDGKKHTGSRFISTGVMTADTSGNVNTVVAGHDFELTEKVEGSTVGYHWELQAETMHPMLINNELTMLVLVEDTTEVPSGVTATKTVSKTVDGEQVAYYKIGNNFYKESAESAALTATNFRRSNLYFTKTVEGAGVPDDAVFPFTFNVVNSEAPASAPSENDDPNHESDWWVWFSVRDKDGNTITQGVTGATNAGGGYWYAPSGQDVTIPVQAGYSIRVGNLPSGTTYTITEGELEEGFSFKESKLTYTTELEGITNADTSFAGAQTTTGTIQLTNTEYTVTYTNKYEMSTVQVVKTFSGITEDQVPADFTATVSYEVADGAPAGTVKPADVVLTIPAAASDDEGSGEQILRAGDTTDAIVPEVSDDGLTYTWTIERVPVGLDVTVTESGTDVDGYTLITQGNDASVTEAASTKATEAGAITTLNLTNKYEEEPGTLTVTKTFSGISENEIPALTIAVTGQGEGAQSYELKTTDTEGLTKNGLTYTWVKEVVAGTYVITESGETVTGYDLATTYTPATETEGDAAATSATVTLTNGGTATASITNAYTAQPGTLTVTKTFSGIQESEIPSGFKITGAGDTDLTIANADDGSSFANGYTWTVELAAGEYTIAESSQSVTGYDLVTKYDNEEVASKAVTLTKGGTASVAISNAYTAQPGTLTVTKTFSGIEESDIPSGFKITGAGDTDLTIANADEGSSFANGYTWTVELAAGEYTISESDQSVADYDVVTKYDNEEVASKAVTLTKGGTASVAISNAYTRQTGYLQIVKYFEGLEEYDGTLPSVEFTVTDADGNSQPVTVAENDEGAFVSDPIEVATGECTVKENSAPSISGYTFVSTDPDGETTVDVTTDDTEREPYQVIFTNTYEPAGGEGTLKIVKTFDGPADLPETTKFKITGPDYNETVSIKDFEQTGEGEYTYEVEVPAGEYTVTENKSSAMVDGYTLHILGDNGVPRQVDEKGYTFRIRNRYADPSDKYVPEELNGEDHYAYMIGYPDGLVHPERNITRAEVATIFFRLLTDEAREANLSTVNSFGDVEDGMWFNVSVSTMANMGIVNGYPDGDFHPNDNITRAEFAAIAARFDKEAKDSANIFTDIDGHWAKSYILRAVNRGWINGYPDSTFRPDRLATRAEVAAMVNRVLVRDPEDPEDLLPDMIEWPDNMDTRAWYYLDIQEATNTHEYERQTKPTEVWMQILENPDWTKYQY